MTMSEHTECALCGAAAAAKVLAIFPGEEQAEAHSLMAEEAEHALPAVQEMAERHAEAQDRILKQQPE